MFVREIIIFQSCLWAKVSATTSGAGVNSTVHPFQSLTRKHGVRCELGQTTQIEVYVSGLANVFGSSAAVAASEMCGRAVFVLKSEAAANKVIEAGIVVGGLFVQVELLSSIGTRTILSNIPYLFFIADHVVVPFLERGMRRSPIRPVPLECSEAALRHILSFNKQVSIDLHKDTEFWHLQNLQHLKKRKTKI